MMKPTFYLDLDRTIFHTERVDQLFLVLERLYPENAALRDGYARRAKYFVFPHLDDGDEKTYYYDLARQLSDAGLNLDEAFAALRTELGDGRLEFEGAFGLVQALKGFGTVKILTYGEDAYQKFKASLCPSVAGLEVLTTVEPKVEYLNAHAETGDWVIDDKVISGLNPEVRAVHIQHDAEKPADAHSLSEAVDFITRRMSYQQG